MLSANAFAEATIRAAYSPMPTPHAIAIPVRSASWRRNGPPIPAGSEGRRSQRKAAESPMSRRSKASTPMARNPAQTAASNATEGQSVTPASGRCPAVQLYQDSGRSASITGASEAYELMR